MSIFPSNSLPQSYSWAQLPMTGWPAWSCSGTDGSGPLRCGRPSRCSPSPGSDSGFPGQSLCPLHRQETFKSTKQLLTEGATNSMWLWVYMFGRGKSWYIGKRKLCREREKEWKTERGGDYLVGTWLWPSGTGPPADPGQCGSGLPGPDYSASAGDRAADPALSAGKKKHCLMYKSSLHTTSLIFSSVYGISQHILTCVGANTRKSLIICSRKSGLSRRKYWGPRGFP